ncbi:cysteine desulfurase-like protein [Ensifer sp. ENS05]|uniref:cysteine desulfurase-like protein n=1 Tax=Ensifer sp. ENS05 TaxID=2769277 RepID=UPI00177B22DF|nr:cysteine desulfurase-like protein [Ensifer sp. ENS05]MBD9596908.1 cysteine desulfurase-like protein [Ensifer sp. ENS05]
MNINIGKTLVAKHSWDIDTVRAAFPSLGMTDNGQRRVYVDAPAGSQVAGRVVDRMRQALVENCANDGGFFRTSVASERLMFDAHDGAAAFLNCSADEVVFGLNTTSLFFAFAYILSRDWKSGDEIVLTRMDHDANIAPWLRMAEEKGVTVRWLEFDAETFQYRYDSLDTLIGEKTRLVACNHASNILGTINDVARIVAAAKSVSAVTVVDAVQSAPHIPLDVKAIGADIVCCSAYKFFGPHTAILYIDAGLRDQIRPLKVRPSPDMMPWRFAPGTPSFESQAGALGAIEHVAWLGTEFGGAAKDSSLRHRIVAGWEASLQYEVELMRQFIEGAASIPHFRLFGISDLQALEQRVPTFSFRLGNKAVGAVAEALASRNIFSWTGSFYAHEAAAVLGIRESGGANRIGLSHYNSREDVEALLDALRLIASE